jgi:hypothetical protein
VAPHRLGLRRLVGVAALAAGIKAALAEEAFAAGDGEGHHDTIADLKLVVVAADLDDLAHGLMAEHVAAFHAWNRSAIDMQIGATDRAGGDLDDRIAPVLDRRIRHALAADVALAMPCQRFHAGSPRFRMSKAKPARRNRFLFWFCAQERTALTEIDQPNSN